MSQNKLELTINASKQIWEQKDSHLWQGYKVHCTYIALALVFTLHSVPVKKLSIFVSSLDISSSVFVTEHRNVIDKIDK